MDESVDGSGIGGCAEPIRGVRARLAGCGGVEHGAYEFLDWFGHRVDLPVDEVLRRSMNDVG